MVFSFWRVAAVVAITSCLGGTDTLAKEETWRKVTTPTFTVITPLDDAAAVNWTNNFTQFVAALQRFIPVNQDRLPRLTVVLFARERNFEKYLPVDANGKPQAVAGFFTRRDAWAVAGLASPRVDEETERTFFHEGTHWFLSAFEVPNPVWLEEGLAEVFSTLEIEKKYVQWGTPIAEHVQVLNMGPPMPLERLLFLAQSDLFTGGDEGTVRTGLAYAQSWAFVHYIIFGQQELPTKVFTDYVQLLRTVHPDEAFRTAFKHTYAEMEARLGAYLQGGTYYTAKLPLAAMPAVKVEAATPSEVEDALGRLALVAGRHDQAGEHAKQLVHLNADDPRGYELLGRALDENGDQTGALAAFAEAASRHSRDFRPYYEIAAAKHRAATESDGTIRHLAEGDARLIADDYEHAIALNSKYRPAYASLAGIIEMLPSVTEQDVAIVTRGRELVPDDGLIAIAMAVLDKRAGRDAEARRRLAEVQASAASQSDTIRHYAQRLEESWQTKNIFEEVDELVAAKKITAALELIDQRLAALSDINMRVPLQDMRRNLMQRQKLEQAKDAWDGRRWVEARQLLTEIVESGAPPFVKAQARRQLEQLDRLGRGKPKPAPESAAPLAPSPEHAD